MSPKISLHIVAWNSMQFLPELMASIEKQTMQDFQVLVIDNGSTDGVQSYLQETYPHVRCLRNARNLGLATAHNQGIRYALEHWSTENLSEKFICVVNPEMILHPSFLETLLSAAEKNVTYGMFGGKILRAYGDQVADEVLKETIHSDRIESVGLVLHKNETWSEQGADALDEGQFNTSMEVFGFSGSLVMYRASALQSIRFADAYFDQDFFMYQEDVDLAFRMRAVGWQAWYEANAVAYHYCSQYEKEHKSVLERLSVHRRMSFKKRFFLTRNYLLCVSKNIDAVSFFLAFPRLVYTGILHLLFMLFFEPQNMRAVFAVLFSIPSIWAKRRWIKKTRVISGRAIRKRFAV